MKFIAALILLACLVSCKTNPHHHEHPRRETASGPSTLPFATAPTFAAYQGPFDINAEGAQRPAAKSYLPLQYDPAKKWPLVVMLHGFSGTAEAEDTYLGLRFRTSLRGFILLTPEGTKIPPGTRGADNADLSGNQFWNATDTCCDFGKTGVDDAGYLLSLIEKIKATYNIDSNKIYLIGHSNGGFMVNRLGCEAGKTFAGIASLAGGTFKDIKNCRAPAAVRYLQIHAVDDKTILYGESPEYAGGKPTVDQWIAKNGCGANSVQSAKRDFVFLIPGVDTDTRSWKNCRSGKEVSLWTIKGSQTRGHSPHVPLLNLNFTDAVLDFLFAH